MSHSRIRHLGPAYVATLAASMTVVVAAHAQAPMQPDVQRQLARTNRANWTLANRFSPVALRSMLYSNAVQPRWLGQSDTMYYNWRDHNGSRFYLVVPATGTKRALFEREKLASQLSEASHKPIDPNNLPFQTLTFLKDHKSFRFTFDSTRYEWSLASGTLKSLGRPPRTPPKDEERDLGGGFGRGGGGGGGRGGFGGGGGRDFRAWSPDSTAFAFARNHNLFVVEVNKADTLKSDTVQVTTDGVLDYSFGFRDTTENRRQLDALGQGGGQQDENDDEDGGVDRSRDQRVRANVTWSPDSKGFAVTRMDQRKVGELYLVNVLAQPRPVLLHYKYAMPGEVNVPQQEVWIFRRGEKQAKQLDLKQWKDERISDLHFPLAFDKVRMVRRDRTQRNLDFIEVDVATGAKKVLLSETLENASIDPLPVRYIKKGGDFLWWSERSGWAHFYVYDFNGGAPKRALSTGAWHVENIAAIDSTRGVVWFTGNGREDGENVYYQHTYRTTGDGLAPVALLDAGNFTHQPTFSPSKRYFVDNYSRIDAPTKSVLRDATTGRVVMDLEDQDISKLKELGWKPPETFITKAADGITDIYGNIWKPFDFDSTKKYPIIANVYPGPQTEGITFNFSPASVPQYLAQLGFIVIQIGNRGGSPQRSLAFHRFGYYNLRDYALADKKAGIEQLAARHSWIDIDRVGIYGHSGGGFLTGAAMLLPPYNDFFKVGWSESGNHDNNVYNQNWSEWNHGLKIVPLRADTLRANNRRNAAGRNSNSRGPAEGEEIVAVDTIQDSIRFEIKVPTNDELAANLHGNLALMHGDLDNNVHPAGTIRLANALIKANKRFDFYVVPGQPHGYRDMSNWTNRMMLEYFAEHLLGDYNKAGADIGK